MLEQVFQDITNSASPITVPVNITATSNSQENKTSQFNIQHCVVNIYNAQQ
jgi:hypothetical protein